MTRTKTILILGGYGNFGTYITRALAQQDSLHILVAGRDVAKAAALADSLKTAAAKVTPCLLDIEDDFHISLAALAPDIVIHTCGPFQGQGYNVAEACVAQGCDYIDLADARDYVCGIDTLDAAARSRGSRIISGASSVPAVTAAVIDAYLPAFGTLTHLDFGISTAQKTTPGAATVRALLSYAGKPFKMLQRGEMKTIYGWQGITRRTFPQLGTRLMSYCDVPDLDLFPKRYPDVQQVTFFAGVEIRAQQITLWLLSFLVRMNILKNLSVLTPLLLAVMPLFNIFGSAKSGFYMRMQGQDHAGAPMDKTFYIVAHDGDGPHLPTLPAIVMARKLMNDRENIPAGAMPCVGLMTLDEYKTAIGDLRIDIIPPA